MHQFPFQDEQYNIGHICTGKQCDLGSGNRVALRWLSPALERTDYRFSDLERESNRFANVLKKLRYSPGDVFFTFLPKMPEQFIAFLGILKLQAIAGTLFSNFGEEALRDRLRQAAGIITKKKFVKKINGIRALFPRLRYIIVVDSDEHLTDDVLSYGRLMRDAGEDFETAGTGKSVPSVLHYTSGSTGKPKGVLHAHGSVLSQYLTTREVLGLGDDDVYWCTADQGWVTGTSYGIIGPWSAGVTQVHFGGAYDAETWLTILEREEVSVWYTAPTALRMLMRESPDLFARFNLRRLRHICSIGEPLNPEIIHWSRAVLGREIYDTWFQTETGAIMIANHPELEIRPGSMGKPVRGIEAAILDADGRPVPDGEPGNLCIKSGWPSMFTTYVNNDEGYGEKFRNGYYYTGDNAYRDRDGYFWFVGRSDDIINTAGHLVSPFEVESSLLELEEVAESAVIGAPDELLFEKVVAFVELHRNHEWSQELELKLRLHISNRVSSVATPQELIVIDAIPKNRSGKVMRRVLKARYLGTDTGDISTLEK